MFREVDVKKVNVVAQSWLGVKGLSYQHPSPCGKRDQTGSRDRAEVG